MVFSFSNPVLHQILIVVFVIRLSILHPRVLCHGKRSSWLVDSSGGSASKRIDHPRLDSSRPPAARQLEWKKRHEASCPGNKGKTLANGEETQSEIPDPELEQAEQHQKRAAESFENGSAVADDDRAGSGCSSNRSRPRRSRRKRPRIGEEQRSDPSSVIVID